MGMPLSVLILPGLVLTAEVSAERANRRGKDYGKEIAKALK